MQWLSVFPGHRTEEVLLPPVGREDGELIRLSVALRGNSGEEGREDFPARRVTCPGRGPSGGGGIWLRVPVVCECGGWRRTRRVSSRSLMVNMW